jgi:hypothetical protein
MKMSEKISFLPDNSGDYANILINNDFFVILYF